MYSTARLLRLGVDWVEGSGAAFRVIDPPAIFTPIASPALPCTAGHPHEPTDGRGPAWLFREDSFDPVTRIRRGRLYRYDDTHRETYSNKQIDYKSPRTGLHSFTPDAAYVAFFPSEDGDHLGRYMLGAQVEIGVAPFMTIWRVVDIEGVPAGASSQLLLTLKAISSLGALPALKEELTTVTGQPIEHRPIQEHVDNLVEALHRQQATPIVDVCRETARMILARWLGEEADALKRKDLGDLVKLLKDNQYLRSAASVVNGMHPRAKSSAREELAPKGHILRPPIDDDADLCARLVGFILRDIGWAVE